MKDSVALFFALGTQWNMAGAGMAGSFPVGLKYEVIPATATALKVELTPTVFNDIRVLEREALRVWSAKRG